MAKQTWLKLSARLVCSPFSKAEEQQGTSALQRQVFIYCRSEFKASSQPLLRIQISCEVASFYPFPSSLRVSAE